MLQLPKKVKLSSEAAAQLKKWQAEIDALPTYKEQIEQAKKSWGKSNNTFREVKSKLRDLSNSTRRCSYCQDSYADEVEHIYPKDIYPDKTWDFGNYLYACGPCNGPKNNRFGWIKAGKLIESDRPRPIPANYVYTKPKKLPIALINPRVEDPFKYLELDIVSSFRFLPAVGVDKVGGVRAKYTIDVLKLNSKDFLVKARRNAYVNYRSRLREYIHQKENGASKAELKELIEGIQDESHPSVWHQMKILKDFIAELKELFKNAPEALKW